MNVAEKLQPTSSRHSHPGPPADKAAVITTATPKPHCILSTSLTLSLSILAAAFSLLYFSFSFVSIYRYLHNQMVYIQQIFFGNRTAR